VTRGPRNPAASIRHAKNIASGIVIGKAMSMQAEPVQKASRSKTEA
jgi:hypothetical protein